MTGLPVHDFVIDGFNGAAKEMADRAEACRSLEELLGVEGNAARLYFGAFDGMIKVEPGEEKPALLRFDFTGRNRRPPRDAVNALLSLAHSLLAKDFTIACYAVGFDPMLGFYQITSHALDDPHSHWT